VTQAGLISDYTQYSRGGVLWWLRWYCPLWGRWPDCLPAARAMHGMHYASFGTGGASISIYGGLDRRGRALDDLYTIFTDRYDLATPVEVHISGVTGAALSPVQFTALIEERAPQMGVACPAGYWNRTTEWEVEEWVSGDGITMRFISEQSDISEECLWAAMDWPTLVAGSAWEEAVLDWPALIDYITHAAPYAVRLVSYHHSTDPACRTSCMRALCQRTSGAEEGMGQRRADGKPLVCSKGDAGVCGDGYACALPGPRHGHQLSDVAVGAGRALLIFGGEQTDFTAAEGRITADVHAGSFNTAEARWAKLVVGDEAGVPCAATTCPAPRTHASVASLDSGGRRMLLVFGGMTGPNPAIRRYLDGEWMPEALDDLWALDLTALTPECLWEGLCLVRLPWRRVPVPGTRVHGVWGAGMHINARTSWLYLSGGQRFDVERQRLVEEDRVAVFRLRDALFSACSATGASLATAVAGQLAQFWVQCRDALGLAAAAAELEVQVEGSVLVSASVFGAGEGKYTVQYLPVIAGQYTISVLVGRGGREYQDLISGVDSNPANEEHEFEPGVQRAKGEGFTVTVIPGITHPPSWISSGDALSLSTAGATAQFELIARDEYGNKRPGGDHVEVVLESLAEGSGEAVSGAVTDRSDGSYLGSYRLSQAGAYRLVVRIGTEIGAGAPFTVVVESGPAAEEMSYVYGTLAAARAGRSADVFVQTRDAYGNFLRADPALYPVGTEQLAFELCDTNPPLDSAPPEAYQRPCAGAGKREEDVTITITYGTGPGGKKLNPRTGEVYWGLYRITMFPFEEGSFYPQVRHNARYLRCFFDAPPDTPSEALDPGPAAVDACVAAVRDLASSSSASRRTRALAPSALSGDSVPDEERRSEGEERRRGFSVAGVEGSSQLEIARSFSPQETSTIRRMLVLGPVLAVVVGVLLEITRATYRTREERKEARRVADLEARFKVMGDVSKAVVRLKKVAADAKRRKSLQDDGAAREGERMSGDEEMESAGQRQEQRALDPVMGVGGAAERGESLLLATPRQLSAASPRDLQHQQHAYSPILPGLQAGIEDWNALEEEEDEEEEERARAWRGREDRSRELHARSTEKDGEEKSADVGKRRVAIEERSSEGGALQDTSAQESAPGRRSGRGETAVRRKLRAQQHGAAGSDMEGGMQTRRQWPPASQAGAARAVSGDGGAVREPGGTFVYTSRPATDLGLPVLSDAGFARARTPLSTLSDDDTTSLWTSTVADSVATLPVPSQRRADVPWRA